jgi:hypothetical protein
MNRSVDVGQIRASNRFYRSRPGVGDRLYTARLRGRYVSLIQMRENRKFLRASRTMCRSAAEHAVWAGARAPNPRV